MDRLELRFYSRKEISEATGRKLDSDQFKRDVLHDLDVWGYEYIWHNRKGVTITGRLESNKLRLKELLVEHLELDTQVDPVEFAQFIAAFWTVEGFSTMTTKRQGKILSELCGRDVSESTITRWRGKLFKSGNAHKFGKAALWKTTTENGIKRQQRVDVNSPEYTFYSFSAVFWLLLTVIETICLILRPCFPNALPDMGCMELLDVSPQIIQS